MGRVVPKSQSGKASLLGQTQGRGWRRPFNVKANHSTIQQELFGGLVGWMAIAMLMQYYAKTLCADGSCEKNPTQVLFLLCCGTSTIIFGLVSNLPFIVAPSIVFAAIQNYDGFTVGGFLAAQFFANVGSAIFIFIASRKDLLKLIPGSLRAGYGCGMSSLVAVLGLRGMGVIRSNYFGFESLTWEGALGFFCLMVAFSDLPWMHKWPLAVIVPVIFTDLIYIYTDRQLYKDAAATHPLANMSKSTFGEIDFRELGNSGDYVFYMFSCAVSLIINNVSATVMLIDVTCFQRLRRTLVNMQNADYLTIIGTSAKFRTMVVLVPAMNAVGNLFGVTSQTVFVQSIISIFAGARTGLSAVTSGILFLITAVVWPWLPILTPTHIQGALGVMCALNFYAIICTIDMSKGANMLNLGLPLLLIALTFSSADSLAVATVVSYLSSILNKIDARWAHEQVKDAKASMKHLSLWSREGPSSKQIAPMDTEGTSRSRPEPLSPLSSSTTNLITSTAAGGRERAGGGGGGERLSVTEDTTSLRDQRQSTATSTTETTLSQQPLFVPFAAGRDQLTPLEEERSKHLVATTRSISISNSNLLLNPTSAAGLVASSSADIVGTNNNTINNNNNNNNNMSTNSSVSGRLSSLPAITTTPNGGDVGPRNRPCWSMSQLSQRKLKTHTRSGTLPPNTFSAEATSALMTSSGSISGWFALIGAVQVGIKVIHDTYF